MKYHSERQDYYAKLARSQGYRSRSAFKLLEIQERFRLIKPSMVVVELGSAPGGWSQVLSRQIKGNGQLLACDRLMMRPVAGCDFIQGDFTDPAVVSQIKQHMNRPADLIVSDMAPDLTGDAFQDQVNTYHLLSTVIDTLAQLLRPKGAFLCKAFHGSEFADFRDLCRSNFTKVQEIKPKSSRPQSNEVFLLSSGYQLC
ncbi:MAG: 23S rRNA methyltransferase [Legionellales bacterium]|nr:23S rRNA methyltransferase [Legionellales bacterium]|tara:strand:+ start:88 stop:684 length:597 start_codon:yes stop_codon:yes gene_type:complete